MAPPLTICYFSTTSLACSAAFEKKRHPALSLPGLALGVLGLVFFIPSIWAEWFEIEAVGKAMGIIGVLSFSFAQACLLSLVTLQRRHAWVFYAAVALILVLAAIISGIIIFEPHVKDWIRAGRRRCGDPRWLLLPLCAGTTPAGREAGDGEVPADLQPDRTGLPSLWRAGYLCHRQDQVPQVLALLPGRNR